MSRAHRISIAASAGVIFTLCSVAPPCTAGFVHADAATTITSESMGPGSRPNPKSDNEPFPQQESPSVEAALMGNSGASTTPAPVTYGSMGGLAAADAKLELPEISAVEFVAQEAGLEIPSVYLSSIFRPPRS